MNIRPSGTNRLVLALFGLLALLAACGRGDFGTSASGSGAETGAVAPHLVWPSTSAQGARTPADAPPGVNSIRATILDASLNKIAQGQWAATPGQPGSGTLSNVPQGTYTLRVDGLASATSTTVIYTGTSSVTVTPGSTTTPTVYMAYGAAGASVASVLNPSALAGDSQVTLQWSKPSGAYAGVAIRRSTGNAPGWNSGTPVCSDDAPTPPSGVATYKICSATGLSASGIVDGGVANPLVNGSAYYYALFSIDPNGNLSGATVLGPVTPQAPLTGAPVITATAGNAAVNISWTAATGATGYNLYWDTTAGITHLTASNRIAHVTSPYSFSGTQSGQQVTNGTTYYFVVTSLTSGGQELDSNVASATPTLPKPPAPTGLSATAGSGQVGLSWAASSGATSYNIYRSTTSTVTASPANSLFQGVTATTYTDTGVTNGTTYYYVVTAVNAGGESVQSSTVSATPQQQATSAPTGLSATAGNNQVILTWSAVTGTGVSYNVYRALSSPVAVSTTNRIASNLSATTYTDTTAVNGTPYYYVVTATPSGGSESAPSAYASATPQAPVAGAPSGLSATAGNNQVILAWSAPTGTGPFTYNVYRAGTSSVSTSSTKIAPNLTATTYTDTTAVNGTTYYYVVTATPSGGTESAASGYASATPQATATGTPTGLSVTPGNARVALSWNAVTGTNVAYNVYRALTSAVTVSVANRIASNLTATTYTDSTVTNGTTYYYVVTAVSGGVESAPSNYASATPQVPPPATPTGLLATPGNGQATVSWNAATGAVTYSVYYGTSPTVNTGCTSSTCKVSGIAATSTVVSPLNNGTTYYFLVSAVNPAGETFATTTVSTIPVGGLPAQVAGVTLTPGPTGTLTVSWTAVNGATGYNIYYGQNATETPTTHDNVLPYGGSNPSDQLQLINGPLYYVSVTAVNATGEGPASATASAQMYPAAPQSLTLTATTGAVNLTWGAAQGAASYNVYYGTNATQGPGTPGTSYQNLLTSISTTASVNGLSPGTLYYFTLSAVNATGETVGMAAALNHPSSALPAPPSLTLTNPNLLTWTYPCPCGGNTFNVYRGTGTGSVTVTLGNRIVSGLTNTTYTDSTQVPATIYSYVVTQVLTVGGVQYESVASNQVSTTPPSSGIMDVNFNSGLPIIFNNPYYNNTPATPNPPYQGNADYPAGVAVDSQDRVVVLDDAYYNQSFNSGTTAAPVYTTKNEQQFLIARWTATGFADGSFGDVYNLSIRPNCTLATVGSTCLNEINTTSGDSAIGVALDQSQNGTLPCTGIDCDRPVVVGDITSGNGLMAWRFHHVNYDGQTDLTFNPAGTPPGVVGSGGDPLNPSGYLYISSMAVDSQGRILVAGTVSDASTPYSNYVPIIGRIRPNGAFDNTFGPGGGFAIQTYQGASATSYPANSIGGYTSTSGYSDSVSAVLVDKSLCPTPPNDTCERYVLVGATQQAGTGNWGLFVARLTNSGTSDGSFGWYANYDTAFNSLGGNYNYPYAGAVDAQGRPVVTGIAADASSNYRATTWRLPNGIPSCPNCQDPTFSGGYVVASALTYSYGTSVAVEPAADLHGSQRIVVSGAGTNPANPATNNVQVWRYSNTGVLDATFNAGGTLDHVVLPNAASGGTSDYSGYGSLAIDSQGRYVIVGQTNGPPYLLDPLCPNGGSCQLVYPSSVAIWRLMP